MRRTVFSSLALLSTVVMSCQTLPERAVSSEAARPSLHAETSDAPPTAAPAVAAASAEVEAVREHLAAHHTGLSAAEIERVAEVIVTEALRHDLEPELVLAVIQVESSCYHRAVSSVGAMGLMQLLPSTGEELARRLGIPWYGPETLFDPVVNVKLGIAYLDQLSDKFEHVPTALAAYNWGPGHIAGRIRRGAALPKVYVKQVMNAYDLVGERASSS